MTSLHRIALIVFCSALITFLSACNYKTASNQNPNMAPLSPRLQTSFNETKTVCFGRFLVDVPATANIVYGFAEAPFPTERLAGEAPRMHEWISRRLLQLEEEIDYAFDDLKKGHEAMYGKIVSGILPSQKLIFGAEKGSGSSYKIDSFIPLGDDLFIQDTIAYTPSDAFKYGNSVTDALRRLNNGALALRSRANNEIPSDVGVCIDGAFIAKPLAESGENFALGIRFKEFPDVHFSINTRVNDRDKEQETIDEIQRLQKDAERDAQRSGHGAWYAGIKFLRRGEREFNGGRGYELLARKPAQGKGTENHQFVFHGGGEAKNELRPAFEMQLDTGADDHRTARVPPSLTDEEAVALWEKLIGSIRVRPTSSKTSQANLPKAPLGSLHVSGRPCPQSGWWECADPLPLAQPSSGVWLQEGDRMPMAHVWLQPTWWQKLKGERPVGQRAAMWRLAGYEAPPKKG